MKTLLILRHAKSSWKHLELSDYDRPAQFTWQTGRATDGEISASARLDP